MSEIAILGAGLTGLSTAYFLGRKDWHLYEKEDRVGGLCRSESREGFLFDYTGHWLHLSRPETRRIVRKLLGENLETHERNAWIYSKGRFTRYPFQQNTYGLPVETVRECLAGFFEAHYQKKWKKPANFEEWILQSFGKGIAKHFMLPYNEKLWTLPPRELTCDWLGRYIPCPDPDDVISGALSDRSSSIGYNATFVYPKTGGIQSLTHAFESRLPGERILTSQEMMQVDLRKRVLTSHNGGRQPFRKLIVSIPLPALLKRISSPSPTLVRISKRLRHNSVLSLNLGIRRPVGEGRHWVYVPEPEFCFYRIGFPGNVSSSTLPPGHGSIYTEIAYRGAPPSPGKMKRRIVRDLVRMGIIKNAGEIVTEHFLNIPCAYVIYDAGRMRALRSIQQYLSGKNVFLAGRYGAWEYSAMEDAILWGKKAAQWTLDSQK